MYCQNCGSALTHGTKYCNRCGTQLAVAGEKGVERQEKRLDEYLDGLFWVTVFGLGLIVGGAVVLRKVDFSNLVILVYVSLSSTLFLINFGLNLWNAMRLMRNAKEARLSIQPAHDTRELGPQRIEPVMMPVSSVTENTTRSFEPAYNKRKSE